MRLVEANETEKRTRDRLTHAAWGTRLDVAAYAQRELRLRAHPWARSSMKSWLLVDDAERPLGSLETFRMDSYLEGERGSCYGVASVFVEPALRRHGHAQRMMELLLARLRALDPAAHASILFSDVGPELYARVGYHPRPAFDWVWTPLPTIAATAGVSLLCPDDLGAALGALRIDDGFTVWPTAEQLDWHHERSRIYAELLAQRGAVGVGARAGASTAFWAADLKNERLVILLLCAHRESEALALVEAARAAAATAALGEVVLWEAPLPVRLEPLGGLRRARTDALPMICPLDSRVRPDGWVHVPRALWI